MTQPQPSELEEDKLFLIDAELIQRLSVAASEMRIAFLELPAEDQRLVDFVPAARSLNIEEFIILFLLGTFAGFLIFVFLNWPPITAL
jgi:hypothetical protein